MTKLLPSHLRQSSSTYFCRSVLNSYAGTSLPTRGAVSRRITAPWPCIVTSKFAFAAPAALARHISSASRLSFQNTIMNGTNGVQRTKRKQYPTSSDDRPSKQHRPINGKESVGENTPEISMYEDDLEEGTRLQTVIGAPGDTAEKV